ncbi:hypothetical protein CF54_02515 [Streptomyces sp. Tu 6176]|uniref:hypothetical protein n=1 Tax=Streptomyces sp. Tu 6176 TaxID=1470557 RepID=UPI000447EB7D|nr:hypothetical protein [Streptomyces sp. Tu 6176]EYT84276.1 hypothetical protein CF54_02515 [Streptomyces sp. Tu 6176]
MEQRIGSSSQPLKSEPVTGAGFDPAFVPGLTSPAAARDTAPEEPEGTPAADAGTPDAEAQPPVPDAADGTAEADEAAEEEPVDGPVFEAADRRARIVADHRGVRLALDDQECEFRWDEIGAVETETPRFGKRFTVTVHTPERRWYPIEIEAPARSRFAAWETELDAVLDAYFEDGEAAEAAEPEQSEESGTDEAAGTAAKSGAETAAESKAKSED